MQAHLKQHGVELVTYADAHVHVSGHPAEADLRRLYDWVRPPAVIPVHGTPRHLAAKPAIATDCHVPTACVIDNGDLCRLGKTGPEVLGRGDVGRLSVAADGQLSPVPADALLNDASDCLLSRQRGSEPRRSLLPQGIDHQADDRHVDD